MHKIDVAIPVNNSSIQGTLTLIPNARALVIFAHGSGSSRFSDRNIFVADILHKAQIATFLFDLLTPEEDQVDQYTREFRFNIELLAKRLIIATNWAATYAATMELPMGYFGASTGAAAALIAAAQLHDIKAVVSRGGRPDLAGPYLLQVQSPTLLIIGERDEEVIKLNELAYSHLQCIKEIKIVPLATHLFEEPGTLEQAAYYARDWFLNYL